MIKINLIAVGRIKEKYFSEGIEEYQKRLGRFCDFTITEIPEENYKKVDDSIIETIKKVEGEKITKALKGYVIITDIGGEKISSEKLAKLIDNLSVSGKGQISIVIGGSYGLSEEVKKKADKKISFSDMTFPHTLFRLMLTEQIYRAFCILEGNPYHK